MSNIKVESGIQIDTEDIDTFISNHLEDICKEYFEKKTYSYQQKNGYYEYDIYADYRDEMDDKTAIKIITSENPMEEFDEKMFDWYQESEWMIEDDIVKGIIEYIEDKFGEANPDEDQIRDITRDMIIINYPNDHFLNQEFYITIMMDTGDGNFDYTLNAHYPCWYGNKIGEPIDEKASLVWLAQQQGYTKEQLENALNDGDVENPKGFLQSVRQESANMTSHMQTLTFLVKMSLRQIIVLNELIKLQDINGHFYDATMNPDCGTITLDKTAMTGLFDPWQGGGSVLEIELDKDVIIPVKYIRSALPDGGDGYSIGEVYGMCGSAWKDCVKSIKDINGNEII